VIEAVPENLELKRSILAEVAGVVSSHCLIASNTSSIEPTHARDREVPAA
jgi:3-hydroxybutyryl-CoA dehydrogenase